MAKLSMVAKLSGAKPLQKLLVADELYADGVHRLVARHARQAFASAKDRAPGSLGSAIGLAFTQSRSKGGFGLIEARVKVNDRSRRGFRYPWALQASKKVRYRHRSGSRAGKLTKAWFSGARPKPKDLKADMAELASRIERSWSAAR